MLSNRKINSLCRGLAAAMLHGEWASDALLANTADALGRKWRWRRRVVTNMLAAYPQQPTYDQLVAAIREDSSFMATMNSGDRPRIMHWFAAPLHMVPAFPQWDLPRLDTLEDLAEWLEMAPPRLDWLADCERRGRRADEHVRRHYTYQWRRKSTGDWRLVEAPRPLLKAAQRRLLHDLLDRIPTHEAACAFRPGGSIMAYATPHANRDIVLRLDLRDFFPSIPAPRVHALFTKLGYPSEVARYLAGLCTTTAPPNVWRQRAGTKLYSAPHLPQGAPTSPALANLCAFRLDRRLASAARSCGAVYTRYADDLAFSGDVTFSRANERFLRLVWRIAAEEGFEIQHRKTRVMHRGVRQHLAGLVVNQHLNIDRRQYDRLKAILTNGIRSGLRSQNREDHPAFLEHLRGRVSFVAQVNPARGARLQALLERIPASKD